MSVEAMLQRLETARPLIEQRDKRYRGLTPLRYAADEIAGDLKFFHVNVCRLSVAAVAERMRVRRVGATVRGRDVSERAGELWLASNMDQVLESVLADALALGSAYLLVWVDRHNVPRISAESARNMIATRDPVTGEVTAAVKKWVELDEHGAVVEDNAVLYTPDEIVRYSMVESGVPRVVERVNNPLGVVPVVPLINVDRVGDTQGYSVIDDLGNLVDALSKVLADMIVASESVARPKRWAAGVDLEDNAADGFTADGVVDDDPLEDQAVSPFAEGNSMWTVENEGAKFGQLPGADLAGYRTAVDLLVQQISTVASLPGHMLGITTSNPSSADAIRAAEASLTSRAESRIRVLGLGVERALALLVAIDQGVMPHEVTPSLRWASASTRSTAQEADAVTKLHSLGIITTEEAREIIGVNDL